MAVTPEGSSNVPHNRPHPLNARWPMLFKPWGSLILSRYFFWVNVYSGIVVALHLDKIVLGDIEMNTKKHEVTADGEVVTLTLKEYELLKRLMKNPNIVMTRDCLLEDIWGYDFDGETRTVDVHVRTLRQKLGKSGEKIETVRGVGYRMSE